MPVHRRLKLFASRHGTARPLSLIAQLGMIVLNMPFAVTLSVENGVLAAREGTVAERELVNCVCGHRF